MKPFIAQRHERNHTMRISIDTRTLEPGDTFIPIKGPNFDGHQFIEEAIRKGAQQILNVDLTSFATQYRKKLNCHMIAVTGSAGKTTIKDMLYYILSQKYRVSRSKENQNNEIGVPLTVLQADSDTEILIVEMAMRQKGQIDELTRIVRPSHAIITNIGLTHIEILKTQRQIALTKAEVFRNPLKWEPLNRFAFLNYSSAYYDLLCQKATQHHFTVLPFRGETPIDQNLNLAYLIGKQFGLSDDEIQAGIAQYQPSEHRLKTIPLPNNILLIDDTYNANPNGVRYALNYLKKFSQRKIFVFGDMLELGNHAIKEHQKVVDSAIDARVDLIYTYGPLSANLKSNQMSISSFQDKKELLKMLLPELKPEDVILVKGSRGMKMEEIVTAIQGGNL